MTNPETGRRIKVGGPTHRKLMKKWDDEDRAANSEWDHSSDDMGDDMGDDTNMADQRSEDQHMKDIMDMMAESPDNIPSDEELDITSQALQQHVDKIRKNMGKGQGSRTRGWSAVAPQKGTERNRLIDQCGDKCFLKPDSKGFPICPKCMEDECECEIDCRGLMAAKVRARQWDHNDIARKADRIGRKKCPDWD